MTSQQWSRSTLWQRSCNEFCQPFHRSCSFFLFWLAVAGPVCCHARPLWLLFLSLRTVHVYIRESRWRLASEQGTVVGMSSEIRKVTGMLADGCVCVPFFPCRWLQLSSDSPSSANREWQNGNVTTHCQQGTFLCAVVDFFWFYWGGGQWYTKGHHKVISV